LSTVFRLLFFPFFNNSNKGNSILLFVRNEGYFCTLLLLQQPSTNFRVSYKWTIYVWFLFLSILSPKKQEENTKCTPFAYSSVLSFNSVRKGIPVRNTPLVSIPPRPFSPVNVLRITSQTLILSINGVKLIFATIYTGSRA
jgi:hypothetical protein